MSIILNALSRSERERLQVAGPRISLVTQPPPTLKRARWPIWLLGGLLLINAALVGGYLLLEQQSRLAAIFGKPVPQGIEPSDEVPTTRSATGAGMSGTRSEAARASAIEPEYETLDGSIVVSDAGAVESSESNLSPRSAPVGAATIVQGTAVAEPERQPRVPDDRTAIDRSDSAPAQVPEVAPVALGADSGRAAEATASVPQLVAQRPQAKESASGSASPAVSEASETDTADPLPAERSSSGTGSTVRPAAVGAMPQESESLAGLTGIVEGTAPPGFDGAADEGFASNVDLAPGPAVAAAPSARDAPEPTRENLPSLHQLPASVVARLPELRIYVHVFDPDREKRFVITNLGKFRAGSEMDRGLRVEEITTDGMVLSYEGTHFHLERN